MDENTGAQPFRVRPFGPWDLLEEQRLTDYVLSEMVSVYSAIIPSLPVYRLRLLLVSPAARPIRKLFSFRI